MGGSPTPSVRDGGASGSAGIDADRTDRDSGRTEMGPEETYSIAALGARAILIIMMKCYFKDVRFVGPSVD